MLYPNGPDSSDKAAIRTGVFVPEGALWFQLDESVGIETFFLIVSENRETFLEDLYNRYAASQESAERARLSGELETVIDRLNRRSRILSRQAERPVRIAGPVRGDEGIPLEWLETAGEEIAADGLYCATIRIRHR